MTRSSLRSRTDTRAPSTVVMGIDPGTLVTGYGIVARIGGSLRLLNCGTIRNNAALALPARLQKIYDNLRDLITSYHPDEVALESVFYGKNAQSALKLGHARGVSLLAAVEQGLRTAEYSPREVKKAIVGQGGATKQQVQYMVRSILQLPETPMSLDTSDAVAIALCHLQRMGTHRVRSGGDWAGYVAAHPERVRR